MRNLLARPNVRSLATFIAIAALLVLTAPVVDVYTKMILTVSFIYALTAVAIDLLWGYAGVLSYAHGALFGIGAYAVAISASSASLGDKVFAALLGTVIGIIAASVVALAIGALSFHSKADWLYVGVVSFAAPFIFERVVLAGGETTGSSSGLSGYVKPLLSPTEWYILTAVILLTVVFAATVLVRSDTGTLFKAIRENETRCTYLGIQVHRVKIALFTATAVLTAFAGALLASSQNVVAPDLGGIMAATVMVIWVALGGRGTLVGPVIAAVVIDYVTAVIGAEFPFVWQLGLGLAFLLVVLYLPGGLMSVVSAPVRWVAAKLPGRGKALESSRGEIHESPCLPPVAGHGAPLLHLEGVTCKFGSLTAVSGIDLDAAVSEVVSIVGPNGAGKSTLMRCISDGKFRTAGTVEIDGRSIARTGPAGVAELGVSQKFQHASVFGPLTVFECLRIARARAARPSLWRRDTDLYLPSAAIRVLDATGLRKVLHEPADTLSHGQKQALELAMVMATDPKIVLLDEPTAGLSHEERTVLGLVFREIATVEGKLVILVEHDLDFVREISSRIVVLHQGELMLDGSVEEVVNSRVVKEIYTGTFEDTELTDAHES